MNGALSLPFEAQEVVGQARKEQTHNKEKDTKT
jgi:hypothetical protein